MSGGRFGYSQHRLTEMVEEIETVIQNNGVKDQWGYADNFSEETLQEFRNGIVALKRAYVYAQRIDWLVSSDDSEEGFHERLKHDLKGLEE
jgi:xylose isomerase